MQQTVTTSEYGSFQSAFDWFNQQLFEGCPLPNVLITLNRHPKSKGYFSFNRFAGRTDADAKVHELALNPDVFTGRSDEDILSTLVHEMAHLWQATHGKLPRAGYHDKQWSAKMESIGLVPSHTGHVGGKKTGQHMTHYIRDGGLYQVAYKTLQASGFLLKWQSPEEVKNGKPKKRSSKTKFTCPVCQQNAWAKADASITCGVCYAADEETVNFMVPEGGFEVPRAKGAGAGADIEGGFDGWLKRRDADEAEGGYEGMVN